MKTVSQSDLAASDGDRHGDKEELPLGLVCPSCGSKVIRRSMRRSLKDRFMSLLGRWPYRCQMCGMRFTGPQDAASIAREAAHEHEEELGDPEADQPDKPKN